MSCRILRITLAALLLPTACFSTDQAVDPPLDEFYFPVGVALGAGGDRLYVANSNFDLQYDKGTLFALDAALLRSRLPSSCVTDGDCSEGDCDDEGTDGRPPSFLCMASGKSPCGLLGERQLAGLDGPGLCLPLPVDERGLLLDSVTIAPFVTEVSYVGFRDSKGNERARLFMPVRGDRTLHWADVEREAGEGVVLDCGQGRGNECDGRHRSQKSAASSTHAALELPAEPVALAATEDGKALVVAHQTLGEVSLFNNTDSGPQLEYVLEDLRAGLRSIVAVPVSRWAQRADVSYQPGFLRTYSFGRGQRPTIELLRYFDRDASGPVGPHLRKARSIAISASASGADSRGIALDDSARDVCEAACDGQSCDTPESKDCAACLEDCAAVPVDVFVANRSPAGLLRGQTRPTRGRNPTDDLAALTSLEPLSVGVSQVVVGSVKDSAGISSSRVFVLAFESDELFIFDPLRSVVEARVRTGKGPNAIVIDEEHALAYVAHFSDSTIGVIDLDRRHASYARYVLTVGNPESAQ